MQPSAERRNEKISTKEDVAITTNNKKPTATAAAQSAIIESVVSTRQYSSTPYLVCKCKSISELGNSTFQSLDAIAIAMYLHI